MAKSGNGIASSFGNYFKNVAKSTAYLTKDVVAAEIPEAAAIADLSINAVATTVDAVKNFDKFAAKIANDVKSSRIGRDISDILRNTVKDIKTGKFYDGERMDDEDSFGSTNLDFQKNVFQKTSQVNTDIARAQMLNDDKNNNINRVVWSKQHAESQQLSITINNNLANIIDTLNDKMIPFMEDVTSYMSDTANIQSNILGALQEVSEIIVSQNKIEESNVYESNKGFSQLFNFDGTLKYADVFEKVKENFNKHFLSNITDVLFDFEGNSIFAQAKDNPIGFLMQTVLQNAIPYELQSTLFDFRRSLGGATAGLFRKLRSEGSKPENKDNFLYTLFNKLTDGFGSVKDKIETDKFEKGPIPFDGVTKKAITHIIPTLLGKIYGALVGRDDDIVVNYNTGDLAWGEHMEDAVLSTLRSAGDNAFYDFQEKMGNILDNQVKYGGDTLPANIADMLKARFAEIFSFIKNDSDFFNFNDPEYKKKLINEFGSAGQRFLDIINSQLFSQTERLTLQSAIVNAAGETDKAIWAAENNAQLSGYAQYQSAKKLNADKSGYKVQKSAAQKATEKRQNERILSDRLMLMEDLGVDDHVKTDIKKALEDNENGKELNLKNFYFMKDHYLRELRERSNSKTFDPNNKAAYNERTNNMNRIERETKAQLNANNNLLDPSRRASQAITKRDNLFLTSLENIYNKLQSGIIVFPTYEENKQAAAEINGAKNAVHTSLNKNEVASMPTEELGKKLRVADNTDAKNYKAFRTTGRLIFDNYDQISHDKLLEYLAEDDLLQTAYGNATTLNMLKAKMPNSKLVYLLDALNNLAASNGDGMRSKLQNSFITKIAGKALGEQTVNMGIEQFVTALSSIDNTINNEKDLYNKLMSKLTGFNNPFIDSVVANIESVLGQTGQISQILNMFGDGDSPILSGLMTANYFKMGGTTFKSASQLDGKGGLKPVKEEIQFDKLLESLDNQNIPFTNISIGSLIPKSIRESKKSEVIVDYLNILQSEDPQKRYKEFMKKHKLNEISKNGDDTTFADKASGLSEQALEYGRELKKELEDLGLKDVSDFLTKIYEASPFEQLLNQVNDLNKEDEIEEEEYVPDVLDFYLGEKIDRKGLTLIRKNILYRDRQSISSIYNRGFIGGILKNLPADGVITPKDIIIAVAKKEIKDFNEEEFKKNFEKDAAEMAVYMGSGGKATDLDQLTEEELKNFDYSKLDLTNIGSANRVGAKNLAKNSIKNNKKSNLISEFMYKITPFPAVSEAIGDLISSMTDGVVNKIDDAMATMYRVVYGQKPDKSDIDKGIIGKMEEDYRNSPDYAPFADDKKFSESVKEFIEKVKSGELFQDASDRLTNGFGFVLDYFKRDDDKGFKSGFKEVGKDFLNFLKGTTLDTLDAGHGLGKYYKDNLVNKNTRRYKEELFGNKFDRRHRGEFMERTANTAERYAPHVGKGLKGAGIAGVAGILLPGPALAYATIGGLATMAQQTGDLNKFLFGSDGKDGKKKKGILPQSWQKTFKKHKLFSSESAKKIGGGVAVGALATTGLAAANAMGLLPHFFMPGGLIGGALLGGAIQLVKSSEGLQSLLFGEKDLFGKRHGGLIPKPVADKFPAMLKWGSVGMLTSYFLPGGPVLNTILGVIGGALGDTKSFKRFLWGNYDPETKFGSKGLIGETFDIVQRRVVNPFMANMTKSFSMNKAIRHQYFSPINNEFKNMYQSVADLIRVFTNNAMKSAYKKIKKTKVGGGIARFIEGLISPIASLGTKFVHGITGSGNLLTKLTGKIFGKISDWADSKTMEILDENNVDGDIAANTYKHMNKKSEGRSTAKAEADRQESAAKKTYKRNKHRNTIDNVGAYTRTFGNKFVQGMYNKREKEEEKMLRNDKELQGYLKEIEMYEDMTKSTYYDPNDERVNFHLTHKGRGKEARKLIQNDPEEMKKYLERKDYAERQLKQLYELRDQRIFDLKKQYGPMLDAKLDKRVGRLKNFAEKWMGEKGGSSLYELQAEYHKTDEESLKALQNKINMIRNNPLQGNKEIEEVTERIARFSDPETEIDLYKQMQFYEYYLDPEKRDKVLGDLERYKEDDEYRKKNLEELESYRNSATLMDQYTMYQNMIDPDRRKNLTKEQIEGQYAELFEEFKKSQDPDALIESLKEKRDALENYMNEGILEQAIKDAKYSEDQGYIDQRIEQVRNFNNFENRGKLNIIKKDMDRVGDEGYLSKLNAKLNFLIDKAFKGSYEEVKGLEEQYEYYSNPETRKNLEAQVAEASSKGSPLMRFLGKRLWKTSDSYIDGLRNEVNRLMVEEGLTADDPKVQKLLNDIDLFSNEEYRKDRQEDIQNYQDIIEMVTGYNLVKDENGKYKVKLDNVNAPTLDDSWRKNKNKDKGKTTKGTKELINDAKEIIGENVDIARQAYGNSDIVSTFANALKMAVTSVREEFPASNTADQEVAVKVAEVQTAANLSAVSEATKNITSSLDAVNKTSGKTVKSVDQLRDDFNAVMRKLFPQLEEDEAPEGEGSEGEGGETPEGESTEGQPEASSDNIAEATDMPEIPQPEGESSDSEEKSDNVAEAVEKPDSIFSFIDMVAGQIKDSFSGFFGSEDTGVEGPDFSEDVTDGLFDKPNDENGKDSIADILDVDSEEDEYEYDNSPTPRVVRRDREEDLAMEVRNIEGTIVDKSDGMSMQEQLALKAQDQMKNDIAAIAANTGSIVTNTDGLEGLFGSKEEGNSLWDFIKSLFDGNGGGLSNIPFLGGLIKGIPGLIKGIPNFVKNLPNLIKGGVKYGLPIIAGIEATTHIWDWMTNDNSYEAQQSGEEALDILSTPSFQKGVQLGGQALVKYGDNIASFFVTKLFNLIAAVEKLLPSRAKDWILDGLARLESRTGEIVQKCGRVLEKAAKLMKIIDVAISAGKMISAFNNPGPYLKTALPTNEYGDPERICTALLVGINEFIMCGMMEESTIGWWTELILGLFGYDASRILAAQQEIVNITQTTNSTVDDTVDMETSTLIESGANDFQRATGIDLGFGSLADFKEEIATKLVAAEAALKRGDQATFDSTMDNIQALYNRASLNGVVLGPVEQLIQEVDQYHIDKALSQGLITEEDVANLTYVKPNYNRDYVTYSDVGFRNDYDEATMAMYEAMKSNDYNNVNNPYNGTAITDYDSWYDFYQKNNSLNGENIVKPEWLNLYEQYAAGYNVTPDELKFGTIDENFIAAVNSGLINQDNIQTVIMEGAYTLKGSTPQELLSYHNEINGTELGVKDFVDQNMDNVYTVRDSNKALYDQEFRTEFEKEEQDFLAKANEHLTINPGEFDINKVPSEWRGLYDDYQNTGLAELSGIDAMQEGKLATFFDKILPEAGYDPKLLEWWNAYKVYASLYNFTPEEITHIDEDFKKDYEARKFTVANIEDVWGDYRINNHKPEELAQIAIDGTGWFNYKNYSQEDLLANHGGYIDETKKAFQNVYTESYETGYQSDLPMPVEEQAVTNNSGEPYVVQGTDGINYYYDPSTGKYYDAYYNEVPTEQLLQSGINPEISKDMNMGDFGGGGFDIQPYITQFETIGTGLTDGYSEQMVTMAGEFTTSTTGFFNDYLTGLNGYYDNVLTALTDTTTNNNPLNIQPNNSFTDGSSEGNTEISLLADHVSEVSNNISDLTTAYGGYQEDKAASLPSPSQLIERPAYKDIDYNKLQNSFGGALEDYYEKAHAQDNLNSVIQKDMGGQLDLEGNTHHYSYSGHKTATEANTTKTGKWELPLDKEGHSYGSFTSIRGWRTVKGSTHYHNGVDIDTETGDKVYSVWPGTVRSAATGYNKGYGSYVWINHDNGLSTLYGHQHKLLVKDGDRIKAGQQIGEAGGDPEQDGDNAGFSTGSHLHLTLFKKQGTDWSSTNGMDTDPRFLWSDEHAVPEDISEAVKSTSYSSVTGSGVTNDVVSQAGSSSQGTPSTIGDTGETTGSPFSDLISEITGILQSSVLGETWNSGSSDSSSPTSGSSSPTSGSSSPIEVKYNGKLGDVNLVDFADLGWKEDFLERIQKGAVSNYLDGGVLPSLTMAQAIGESDWGRSGLTQQGNALFGIKAGPNWSGKVWTGDTIEYYDGTNPSHVTDSFRAYDSWDESIADHGNLMKKDLYSKVVQATTIEDAAREVKAAGYATDPGYTSFLLDLVGDNNLRAVDEAAKAGRGGMGGEETSEPAAKPSLGQRAFQYIGTKALQLKEEMKQSLWGQVKSEIAARQQEQAQFRKRAQGGFLSSAGNMLMNAGANAIDGLKENFTSSLSTAMENKNEELKQFRDQGGYYENEDELMEGGKGGIFNTLVNKATNVVKSVVDKITGKKNKTTTTTVTSKPTSSSSPSSTVPDQVLPNTETVEKIVTEIQPGKFKDNGVAEDGMTVTALGNKTDSPLKALDDSYTKYKSRMDQLSLEKQSHSTNVFGGYVGDSKPPKQVSPSQKKGLERKLEKLQVEAGVEEGKLGGIVEDIFSNAKKTAEENRRTAMETSNIIAETNNNTEKRMKEIKHRQEVNSKNAENLLKDSMDKVKNTVSTYQNDISSTINSTLNADSFMRNNMDDSNWDQLLSLMQSLCDNTEEIASNTSNIDSTSSNIANSISDMSTGNVNITNNNLGNIKDNETTRSTADVSSYVKNIFMGNEAGNSLQSTNNILRNKIGIMARGD